MTFDPLDEYDIKMAFEVLDIEKVNRITLANFHTLYLGLGFEPKQLTLQELQVKVEAAIHHREDAQAEGIFTSAEDDAEMMDTDSLPLSLVLEILSDSRFLRDRASELDRNFRLLDEGGKGFIDATDLQKLSEDVGEPLSKEESKVLVNATMDPNRFSNVFSPPSP